MLGPFVFRSGNFRLESSVPVIYVRLSPRILRSITGIFCPSGMDYPGTQDDTSVGSRVIKNVLIVLPKEELAPIPLKVADTLYADRNKTLYWFCNGNTIL